MPALFLFGVLLYIVGSLLERRERAQREKWWRELYGSEDMRRVGSPTRRS